MPNPFKVQRKAFASATPYLYLIVGVYSLGNVFYGFDSSSFSGIQTMQPFTKEFGKYSASTKTYSLPTRTKSLMNSIPLIGKLLGALLAGQGLQTVGHRYAMMLCCAFQLLGVILELSTKSTVQYTAGRFMVYIAVGIVENVVPAYASDVSPAPLRGFFVGSLQTFLNIGSLLAAITNNYCAKSGTALGWKLASGVQGIPAVLILAMLAFTPDSPRWLITKGKDEQAIAVLKKIRPQSEVDAEGCEAEVMAIKQANESTSKEGSWLGLFSDSVTRRRTGIATVILTFQQLCGITFVTSYGPTFYSEVGLAANSFEYQVITLACATVAAVAGMVISDLYGRRIVTIAGALLCTLFLCLVAGLGSITPATTSSNNGMVASVVLYTCVMSLSLTPIPYIVGAEVGTKALREKTMSFATSVNVVASFVVVYTIPYLLDNAGLGSKTAYIYAGFCFLAAVWAALFLPELKDRSLEELDELFSTKPPLPAWKFKQYETVGPGRLIHEIESGITPSKGTAKFIEDIAEGEVA